jgi:hypothetical protein
MKLTQLAAAALLGTASSFSGAATLLTEDFGSVPGLAGAGWVTVNASSPAGSGWFQGNIGVFNALSGAADSYAGVDFNSSSGVTGSIDNWLMAPVLTVGAGDTVNFFVRAAGSFAPLTFTDNLEVWWSVGTGTAIAGFTTLLGSYSSSVDAGWVAQSYALGAGTGRIGLRYVNADASLANYLGVDTFSVETAAAVPEPGSSALAVVALAALLVSRRQRVKA